VKPGTLDLVPIYLSDREEWLRSLAGTLERTFAMTVHVRPPWFDPEDSFDPSRGQYNSTRLLELLLGTGAAVGRKVLGVTSVDLFIPILTYVFGEAQLDGTAAVVSTHRLVAEAYGLKPDEALLRDRLAKEAVHELGHTFGLVHCADARCVMHASTYVEEIDLKSELFCAACLRGVRVAS
jgi:archaemetzincin